MKYSIIIPALNEEKRISKTLDALIMFTKKQKLDAEIIVVAAKGVDRTIQIVEEYTKKNKIITLLKPGEPIGKGRDVKKGMLAATGDFHIFMDADLATPLKYLKNMTDIANKKSDIIVGIRPLDKIHKGPRRLLSLGWNLLARIFLKISISDTQCGFKLFSKDASKLIFNNLESQKWLFDMEVIVAANFYSLKIDEIEISEWQNQPGGSFNKQIIRDSLATLAEFFSIYRLKRTKYSK